MSPTSMKFAVSVGIVLMCITPIFKCQQLIVGQKANENQACLNGVNQQLCTQIYQPVCAKLGTAYYQASNPCTFCSQYGNTAALILQVGLNSDGRDFSCKELQVGGLLNDDPECRFWFGKTGCTREFRPYCATIDNYRTYREGSNKCVFCSQYGNNTNARIIGIGGGDSATCTPLKIGTRANEDIGCKFLANVPQACTLEFAQVCGQYNGSNVREGNKCAFCSKYGNFDALITRCPVN